MPLKPLGGGGYNSLKEKENDDNPQSDDDTGDSGESQVTTYTYKSYLDYFIDNMDCTGVYDTDGNLTNVTISAEKKAEILSYDFTGNGTISEPYQINTAQGFWYMSKFADLTNKYVELNCDVILNDEEFDENGIASGGDGTIYSWISKPCNPFLLFNGQGHKISGAYYNNEVNGFAFFNTTGPAGKLSNLKFENYYISFSAIGAVIIRRCKVISNVSSKGFLRTTGYSSAIVETLQQSMEDCESYCDILPNGSLGSLVGGLCSEVSGEEIQFINCKNYGRIEGKNCIGGIVACPTKNVKFINCVNYGEIEGSHAVGGFVGKIESDNDFRFFNCKNYGNVVGNSYVGGYIGYNFIAKVLLSNCIQNGTIESTVNSVSAGCLLGELGKGTSVFIDDCDIQSLNSCSVIGYVNNSIININGLLYTAKYKENIYNNIIANFVKGESNLSIQNVIVVINCDSYTKIFSPKCDFINNVIIKVYCDSFTNRGNYILSENAKEMNGILFTVHSPTILLKHYYGTNFRDFYMSWKYGTIGLKTLDGEGSYQGTITMAWLEENGWVKKS